MPPNIAVLPKVIDFDIAKLRQSMPEIAPDLPGCKLLLTDDKFVIREELGAGGSTEHHACPL